MKQYNYIYLITNQINDKIYIGKHSTDNIDDGYMGSGVVIKRAIKKYGEENFTKEYLVFCDTKEKLNWFEKFYIKKYKAKEVGYNLTDGGDGGNTMGGKHLSEERKQKITGVKNGMYGKKHTSESKLKMSEAKKGKPSHQKGKHLSEETKQKMRDNHADFKREKHPMFGKHISDEHKEKLKYPRSEETKQKMREAALKREAAKRQKNKENIL